MEDLMISRKTLFLTAAFAVAAMAGVAGAQPDDRYGRDDRGRDGSAVLYEFPNFQGRQVVVEDDVENLSRRGFNDIAQSARLEGSWRLCENADYGGRCETLQGAVPDLNRYGLGNRLSSLQSLRGGGGWDDGYDRPGRGVERGVQGVRTVFFPRPAVRGMDVAAGANGANTYCRRQGLGPAVYYDSNEWAPRAVAPDGRIVGRSTVLRDLLCRKY
jgi:Beta/Gamma crystallin